MALIEAMAAGRPVVATRVGGTPDLLRGGERGRLVPPADPETLARAILEALAEPATASRRSQAAREHVLARHSIERLVHDVDSLYREMADRRAAA